MFRALRVEGLGFTVMASGLWVPPATADFDIACISFVVEPCSFPKP